MAADPLGAAAWAAAWRQAGARAPDPALRDVLIASYDEPQRGYHTGQHLREVLTLLPRWAGHAEHPASVALALWFHDAVYDPTRPDNEQRSADWARSAAWAAGAPDELADSLHALVLATRLGAVPQGRDALLLVDIDLGILGAEPSRFDEYEAQVRREYGHVPEPAYRDGRRRILQQFLARPAIYRTPVAHRALEARARANLRRSVARLGG